MKPDPLERTSRLPLPSRSPRPRAATCSTSSLTTEGPTASTAEIPASEYASSALERALSSSETLFIEPPAWFHRDDKEANPLGTGTALAQPTSRRGPLGARAPGESLRFGVIARERAGPCGSAWRTVHAAPGEASCATTAGH